MTLHFSQIGLTDDLTFTAKASFQTSSVAIIAQPFLSTQGKFYKIYKDENCKLFLQLFQKTFYLISIYKSYSKNAYFLLFRNIIARQKDWHNVSLKTNIKLLYFKSDIAFLLCIGH